MYCDNSRSLRRRAVVAMSAVLLSCLMAVPAVEAAQPQDAAGSLGFVPEDAPFYTAMLRNREQIDILLESKAWAELQTIPSVQMGMMFAQMSLAQLDSPWQQVQAFFAESENQKLLEVLKDMVSDEVFCYGSADCIELLSLFMELNRATQFAPFLAMAQGDMTGSSQLQAKLVSQTLVKNIDRLVVPDVVIGFKTNKPDEATTQLARLEELLNQLIGIVPELEGHFERETLGSHEYLTLRLDGSMLPWDELNRDDFPINDDDYDQLIDHLKNQTVVISLGVRDDYILLSIGNDNDHLARLGSGSQLANRKEFERLAAHTDARVTGMSYASETLSNSSQDIDSLVETALELLPSADLESELEKRVESDIRALAEEFKRHLPVPGAMLSVGTMTSRGLEQFTYNWAQSDALDGSKTLPLLDHLDGDPLLAILARGKTKLEDYRTMVRWLQKAHGYFEEIALPMFDEDDRDEYQQAKEQIMPLLSRLEKTTESHLLPALADGQIGLVLDAKIASRHWHTEMPESAEPLPMFEPAIVLGVSDASKLEQAMGEYWAILRDAVEVVSELSGEELPPGFEVPSPKIREVSAGKIYSFPLPEMAGIDKQIAPSAGLDDSVAVLTISPALAKRLLTKTPLQREGPLRRADQPLCAATVLNFAACVDAVRPWIDWAIRMNLSDGEQAQEIAGTVLLDAEAALGVVQVVALAQVEDTPQVKQILDQVHKALEIVQVIRGYRSVTYRENGATVTHGELRLADRP